jgi:DNA-binding NarL/FixJ family response regulator
MRVVIAEDTALLREGLAGLLEDAGHDVVARVGDAEALLAVVAEHDPDLAVVDVRMPPTY